MIWNSPVEDNSYWLNTSVRPIYYNSTNKPKMPLIQFTLSLYFESLLYEKHLLAYTGDIRMNINLIEEKTENKQGSGQVNVNEINV